MVKYLIKLFWGEVFYYVGLFHIVSFLYNVWGKRITIVTYHRITEKKINEIEASLPFLFTSQQAFEKQLGFLKKYYRLITFKDLIAYDKIENIPWNSLIITFDDGYEDNFFKASIILEKMHLAGTFFIPANNIGLENCDLYWWDRAFYYFGEMQKQKYDKKKLIDGIDKRILPFFQEFINNPSNLFQSLNEWDTEEIELMLDEIQEKYKIDNKKMCMENRVLNKEQVFILGERGDIGSHGCSHYNLLKVSQDRKFYEVHESKRIIEEISKKKVLAFSCPGGNMDGDLGKLVRDAGYEFAVTTKSGINDMDDRYSLKRINIWDGTSLSLNGKFSKGFFAFKLLGF